MVEPDKAKEIIAYPGWEILKKKKPSVVFKNPASELSIFVSAMQNRYAGMKLPRMPDNNI